jgi:hypothetical protein
MSSKQTHLDHVATIQYVLSDRLELLDVIQNGSDLRIVRVDQAKCGHVDEIVLEVVQIKHLNVLERVHKESQLISMKINIQFGRPIRVGLVNEANVCEE